VPLAHTILGVLLDAPAHGYAIKKQLSAAHPEGSAINDGQLYPTLARMEQSGWIRKQVVEQRRTPSKHLFRLTAAGRREFFQWLGASGGESAGLGLSRKSDFLRRCAFFQHLDPDRVALHVRSEQGLVERTLLRLEQLAQSEADPYRRKLVEYGIRVQRMRRQWLEELLVCSVGRTAPAAALASAQSG
jgi:DNA-binding PadR family transcriptional regulator